MATYWENSCSFGLRYVSWYKCLIVSLVFSHLGFWSGNLFLIAPFPDLCLLVPFQSATVRWKNKYRNSSERLSIGGLIVNNILGNTVSVLFCFDLAFITNWSQIVLAPAPRPPYR